MLETAGIASDALLGAHVIAGEGGEYTHFAVRPHAEAVTLCIFAQGEEYPTPMHRQGEFWRTTLKGNLAGATYGYRADGVWAPSRACGSIRPNCWSILMPSSWIGASFTTCSVAVRRRYGGAGARAIVPGREPVPGEAPHFARGGLIYELNVRGFTLLHPDVPEALRGTMAALAHPVIIAHLKKLSVSAVELMPIVAWVDERHLPPLGLRNFWGYNPVAMMALDPGLCPGGVAELRDTVAALHAAGIGVILDLVFNHSGESDEGGPVLCCAGWTMRATPMRRMASW
jgi:glycogen operon protein